jgi:AraC family transcriptional regulator of adaptative response/methylated-DNA-[protein]-cysteine methyltransferase
MLDAEKCWQAVTERDAAQDGAFFYGVRTTGVFCRPNCRSRLPKRENVAFFATIAEAERAGLRACKRCRPSERSQVEAQLAAVAKACELLRASDSPPTLEALSAAVAVSPFHFHRLFKQVTGVTPREYARAAKVDRFTDALDAGKPVTEAAYGAGLGSSSRVHAVSDAGLGMTPRARRSKGKGERIRFATAKSALGFVLVAATERGICAAELGDSRESLERALRERFTAADVREDASALRAWLGQIVAHIASPGLELELPLDARGTAFQATVWRALRRVPLGRTATYSELAAALGRPSAVRAVAQACASNPVALLVPCHRAVRKNGELGGYRWGVERKRALLARERDAAAGAPKLRARRRG